MIITVTLNPALDKTVTMPGFAVNTVNRVQSTRLDPGGKGINVSKSVKALGGRTLAISVLGGATGGYIKASLDKMAIPNDMVITGDSTRTNLKIVDPVLGTNTDINEPGSPISQELLEKVWEKLSAAVKPGDTVVFAGKNPPQMADELLADWISLLKSRGVRVCVDTVGEPMRLALEQKPHIIKPNRMEFSELTGRDMRSVDEIVREAKKLVDQGVELVTVSLGGDGAVYANMSGENGHCPAIEVQVKDTTGAGDAFCAGVSIGLTYGKTLRESIEIGSQLAASVITSSENVCPRFLPRELGLDIEAEH